MWPTENCKPLQWPLSFSYTNHSYVPTFLDIMSDFFSQVWPKCHWWQSMLQNTARALLRKNNFNIWAIEVNLTPHGNLTPPEASKVAIGESYSSTMFKVAFSQQKFKKKGTRLAKLYYYPYSIEQVQLISHNLFWKKSLPNPWCARIQNGLRSASSHFPLWKWGGLAGGPKKSPRKKPGIQHDTRAKFIRFFVCTAHKMAQNREHDKVSATLRWHAFHIYWRIWSWAQGLASTSTGHRKLISMNYLWISLKLDKTYHTIHGPWFSCICIDLVGFWWFSCR